jgi:hypothetical protein
MKNLKSTLLLFAALTIGLTSCRKNGPDEDGPKVENQAQLEAKAKILGKWKITDAVFIKTVTGQAPQAPRTYDLRSDDFYFDFKTNNTVMVNYKTRVGEYNFSFSEDGKKFTITKAGTSSLVLDVKQNTETALLLRTTHSFPAENAIETEDITLQKTN